MLPVPKRTGNNLVALRVTPNIINQIFAKMKKAGGLPGSKNVLMNGLSGFDAIPTAYNSSGHKGIKSQEVNLIKKAKSKHASRATVSAFLNLNFLKNSNWSLFLE